jgi:Acetyltransferase (isoleucine patch superfamily)
VINSIFVRVVLFIEKLMTYIRLNAHGVHFESDIKIAGLIYVSNAGEIHISSGVKINSTLFKNPIGVNRCSFATEKNAVIYIGKNVGMTSVVIYAKEEVIVGDNVFLGAGVKIYDTDFHSLEFKDRSELGDINAKSKKVILNEGCFIGSNATILKGVVVGSKSIVGAGSIVTTSIPASEVWAGVPARFIKKC